MLRLLTLLILAVGLWCGSPALAQEISIDIGADGSLSLRAIQLFVLLTLLSLAPGLAIMVTCFPFMITVLAILRQAIGVQQAPPNMLLVSMALFLSWFVMEPVFRQAWADGIAPMTEGLLTPEQAMPLVAAPFRAFMQGRTDPEVILRLAAAIPDRFPVAELQETPLQLLVPSFVLSEVQRGFEVGFLVFLPFLVIDLVVAALLMSLGMMMVPPAAVALPFKLAFFVLADGWSLLSGALVGGYG